MRKVASQKCRSRLPCVRTTHVNEPQPVVRTRLDSTACAGAMRQHTFVHSRRVRPFPSFVRSTSSGHCLSKRSIAPSSFGWTCRAASWDTVTDQRANVSRVCVLVIPASLSRGGVPSDGGGVRWSSTTGASACCRSRDSMTPLARLRCAAVRSRPKSSESDGGWADPTDRSSSTGDAKSSSLQLPTRNTHLQRVGRCW
eukprot:3299790-Prymnesium_polylepis.5